MTIPKHICLETCDFTLTGNPPQGFTMERHPIKSRAIRSMGYDPDLLMLEIEFTNGGLYQYYRVPSSTYQELCAADSKGTFVNQSIKPHFQCREISRGASAESSGC